MPRRHDCILIVDFGSQVTQLIARRIREAGVYCEIHPFQNAGDAFERLKPKAVILSGGPASVTEPGSPRAPQAVFEAGVPILGHLLRPADAVRCSSAARSRAAHAREFGRADVEIQSSSPLFDGVWEVGGRYPVWMSHGDRVTELPAGFSVAATSDNAPFAIAVDEKRRFYTVMFHPEVVHTPDGARLLHNFVHEIAGLRVRLDDGRLSPRDDREDPRPGRPRAASSAACPAASTRPSPPCSSTRRSASS